jgi:hypothetical protein
VLRSHLSQCAPPDPAWHQHSVQLPSANSSRHGQP